MNAIAYSVKEVARARHREFRETKDIHEHLLHYKTGYRLSKAYKERQRKIESFYRYDLLRYLEHGLKTRKTHNYTHSPVEKVVKKMGSGGYILLPKAWVGRNVSVSLLSEKAEHDSK